MSLLTKAGGISKLSELEIDTSKDWAGHLLKNIGTAVDDTDAVRKAQAILQAIISTKGDIMFRGDSEAERLAPDAGKGYNFLRSRGSGMSPIWEDIENLIQYMTGAMNRSVVFDHEIAAPMLSMIALAGFSPPGRTANPLLSIPEPGISLAAVPASGGGVAATPVLAIPELGVSEDTMVVYEYYRTGDNAHDEIHGNNWEAQTFTPQVNHSIGKVYIRVFRTGSPGTVTVGIYATSGGLPTGSALVTNTINGNDLPEVSPGVWKLIIFAPTALAAATKYAIVVSASSGDLSNYLCWRADASSPAYTGGARCYSADGGSNWIEDTNQDYMFEEGR